MMKRARKYDILDVEYWEPHFKFLKGAALLYLFLGFFLLIVLLSTDSFYVVEWIDDPCGFQYTEADFLTELKDEFDDDLANGRPLGQYKPEANYHLNYNSEYYVNFRKVMYNDFEKKRHAEIEQRISSSLVLGCCMTMYAYLYWFWGE